MTDLFDVSGWIVCVTGASGGPGRASATLLANAGAQVVGVARRADKLAEWQAETTAATASVAADLLDRSSLARVAADAAAPLARQTS